MDPYRFNQKRTRPDALIALVLAFAAAWLAARFLGALILGSTILLTLVAIAAGAAWYHYRKVL
ncbi:MAG TPA: hypothetical protein VNE62_09215 [Actinomycetota bacterium]|nr:hypothetical protein [Actinomycetota bacterium]